MGRKEVAMSNAKTFNDAAKALRSSLQAEITGEDVCNIEAIETSIEGYKSLAGIANKVFQTMKLKQNAIQSMAVKNRLGHNVSDDEKEFNKTYKAASKFMTVYQEAKVLVKELEA